jgi:DNA mismatch repair protein MutS
VLGAEERIRALEYEIFETVRGQAAKETDRILGTARAVAALDVLRALAHSARAHGDVRPVVDDSTVIEIVGGRHPVLDRESRDLPFVPNDVRLDGEETQLVLLTGPNMAGKSTYMRQTALLVILAQMGAFIPAKSARIGVVDRIFTRVGARDNLAGGQSTFLVEMSETANILHHATPRSLILLDEIGRGTSTYDGLAIAWAVAEYLHERLPGAKVLFATHYHELTQLADHFSRARNFHVAVREWNDEIIFLHAVRPGGTDRSYGIQVARLAGLPPEVIARAKVLLGDLEARGTAGSATGGAQLALFPPPAGLAADLIEELARLDTDRLTPLQALTKLQEWRARLPR